MDNQEMKNRSDIEFYRESFMLKKATELISQAQCSLKDASEHREYLSQHRGNATILLRAALAILDMR